MGALNSQNLDVANTLVHGGLSRIFGQAGQGSVFQIFTEMIPASGGTSVELVVFDGTPPIREWTGMKQYIQGRSYKKNHVLRKWEATIELPRTLFVGDQSGAITSRINTWLSNLERSLDKIVIDELVANTAANAYDGQAILSNSHPNVNGANHDNLEAAALTFALYKTAVQQMELIKDEAGEPLGFYPTHLLVGPKQRRIAMEVTGPDRHVGVDAASAQDPASGGVAAVLFRNFLGVGVQPIVTSRITGNEWFVMDNSKPGVRPMALCEFRPPEAVSLTDMTSTPRFERDVFQWSIETDTTPAPYAWQAVHGSVTA